DGDEDVRRMEGADREDAEEGRGALALVAVLDVRRHEAAAVDVHLRRDLGILAQRVDDATVAREYVGGQLDRHVVERSAIRENQLHSLLLSAHPTTSRPRPRSRGISVSESRNSAVTMTAEPMHHRHQARITNASR